MYRSAVLVVETLNTTTRKVVTGVWSGYYYSIVSMSTFINRVNQKCYSDPFPINSKVNYLLLKFGVINVPNGFYCVDYLLS